MLKHKSLDFLWTLLLSSSVVINLLWELRFGGLLRVVLMSFILRGASSPMDFLPFPAPLREGFRFFLFNCVVLIKWTGVVGWMLHIA
jgi:hypothetical protein